MNVRAGPLSPAGNYSRSNHTVRLLSWASQQVTLEGTQVPGFGPIVPLDAFLAMDLADPAGGCWPGRGGVYNCGWRAWG